MQFLEAKSYISNKRNNKLHNKSLILM